MMMMMMMMMLMLTRIMSVFLCLFLVFFAERGLWGLGFGVLGCIGFRN